MKTGRVLWLLGSTALLFGLIVVLLPQTPTPETKATAVVEPTAVEPTPQAVVEAADTESEEQARDVVLPDVVARSHIPTEQLQGLDFKVVPSRRNMPVVTHIQTENAKRLDKELTSIFVPKTKKFPRKPKPHVSFDDGAEALALPGQFSENEGTGRAPLITFLSTTIFNSGFAPADPHGAAGPVHVVNVVNTNFRFHEKSTGAVTSTGSLITFFNPVIANTNNIITDPKVLYDQYEDRFVIILLEVPNATADARILIGVSDDSDPNGTWYLSWVDASIMLAGEATAADYPGLGMDEAAIFVTANQFGTTNFRNSLIYVIDKGLTGGLYDGTSNGAELTADVIVPSVVPESRNFTIQPAHQFGVHPDADNRNYFTAYTGLNSAGSAFVNLYELLDDPMNPGQYILLQDYVNIGAVDNTGALMPGAEQPGGAGLLDTINRSVFDADWRDDRLHLALLVNPSNPSPDAGQPTARWAEIDTTVSGNPVSSNGANVGGEDLGVGTNTFYPALAVNANGDVGIGFSASSTTLNPGAYYTVHESTDGPGVVQPSEAVQVGLNTYEDTNGNRWGDYSGIAVDPVNNSFWVYNKFGSATQDAWATVWGQFFVGPPPTSVAFDRTNYGCDDLAVVNVIDDTQSATATVTSSTDSEVVSLSAVDSLRTTGSIALAIGDTTNDNGVLGVAEGDTITVTYETIHNDTAPIVCTLDASTGGAFLSGGCDSWTTADPLVNTGEKWLPYADTDELLVFSYTVVNNELRTVDNVILEFDDTAVSPPSGCLSVLSQNPLNIGSIPAGETASGNWSVRVETCPSLTEITLEVTVTADGYQNPLVLADVNSIVNADDVIEQHGVCFNHTAADMTSLAWTADGFADIGWQRSSQPGCGFEDRTVGTCFDASAGMYKQTNCGGTSIPGNSAGTLVPTTPISLINSGTDGGTGQPWRYGMTYFSFDTSTSVTGEDDVIWGLFLDDDYQGAQVIDGATPLDQNNDGTGWPISAAFFSMAALDCCDPTPGAWDWDASNAVSPATAFCEPVTDVTENRLTICIGSAAAGVSQAGDIEMPGDHSLNFALLAVEEQLFGIADGVATDGFGIDNTELGWEEFHAGPNTGDCGVSGQCGQVSFSVGTLQTSCQNEPVEIRVIDGDAIGSSLMVTVTSTSGGDSEAVVLSRQGASELFLGSVAVSTVSGSSVGDGVVFALPADQLLATYDDLDDGTGSPCSDVTSALTDYPSANISIASRTVTMDNGDADNNPDTNEDFAFELELFNDSATTLTNATVFIETDSLAVSCLIRDSADFGTILGGAMVSNPGSPFRFQVDPAYECDAMGDPDTLTFGVTVLSDEICGADGRLTTSFTLDIDLGGGPIAPPPPSAQLAFSDEDSRDPDARFGSVPIQRSSSRVLEASTTSRPVATVGQDPMSISPPAGDEESDTNRAEGFIVQASSTEGVVSVTRGTPGDAQVNATRAVCGNAQYDNGTADTAEWFNGGMAGNTDCAMGQLWNASDFGIVGDYEVTAICIDNSINFGGPWPNHWYMHPDLAGAPDFGTILADGILSSGDGAGQVEFPLPAPVGFTAGQNYWIVVRGDPVCCSGEDFNLEVDQVTAAVQSFRNDCDGVANMTTPSTGEYVIHSTIFASNLVCDTTDNSGLPTSCATSVSEPGSSPLLVSRIPGPVNNIVDLEFEDAGSVFDYNVFVSNSASSLAAAPFDVEGPNGRKDCAVVTSDLGATREITGYDVGAGITGNDLVFILVGTSTAVHNGPLGDNTPEGARNSTSLCVAVP